MDFAKPCRMSGQGRVREMQSIPSISPGIYSHPLLCLQNSPSPSKPHPTQVLSLLPLELKLPQALWWRCWPRWREGRASSQKKCLPSHHAVGKGIIGAGAFDGRFREQVFADLWVSWTGKEEEGPWPVEIKFLEVLLPEPWGRLEPRWRGMD